MQIFLKIKLNDDTNDANDTFVDKNNTIDENDTFFKKNDIILSSKSCFLNGNKRKLEFQFSTSRNATN